MARSPGFIAPPCAYFEECGRESWSKGMCLMHYKRARRGGDPARPRQIGNGRSPEYHLRHHGWTVAEAGCWEWNGLTFVRNGAPDYGALYIGGETRLAHRVAYETWVGPIEDGLFVCHSCDNRLCIRPEHLWLGTNRDNMEDMAAKGRATKLRGEGVATSVLTEGAVREIRARRSGGELLRVIARDFGISESTVSGIARRRSWAWLD